MTFSDDAHSFEIRVHGALTFTDDLTDVESMSDGGVLTIRDRSKATGESVEIRSANGAIERTYFVGGEKRLWNDEAKRFLSTQLPTIVRRSGINAGPRVRSILNRKGVGGVLDEIDLLGGDYARRLYLIALIDLAHLDSRAIEPILQRVSRLFTSDYDRRQVLEHVATHLALDRKGAASYVQAMATMRSDYDQREALAALTKSGGMALSEDMWIPVLAHLKSNYDKRMVLEDILSRGPLSRAGKHTVLAAAEQITSDYDRRQVLTTYVDRVGVEPAAREPLFAAVRGIRSQYDRREVLTRVAVNGAGDKDIRAALIAAVGDMTSDHERAELLLVIAPHIDTASRPAFVAATERIKSSHDQQRVFAALR